MARRSADRARVQKPYVHGLDQRLVVVCAHGYSSSLAAATLQDLGFTHATDVVGGFEAWKERGLPVRPAPEVDADAVPGWALRTRDRRADRRRVDSGRGRPGRAQRAGRDRAAGLEHMREARAVVERAVAKGAPVYGLTTGVGMRRDARVAAEEAAAFNRSAIAGISSGSGRPPPATSCALRCCGSRTGSSPDTRARVPSSRSASSRR